MSAEAKTTKPRIGRKVLYARDFRESAEKNKKTFGKTEMYQSYLPGLNRYLGGGIGRQGNYEICVIYGDTGIGKSTVTANLMARSMAEGKKVGMFLLEDQPDDFLNRLELMFGSENYNRMMAQDSVRILCDEQLEENETEGWTLDNLADEVADWFADNTYGVDVIVLDPIQMAFDGAVTEAGQNKYDLQERFMRRMNRITKQYRKTVIIVSHVNKTQNTGLARIHGTSALAKAASKIIEVTQTQDMKNLELLLRKSRHTRPRYEPYLVHINASTFRMEDVTGASL